MKPFKDLTVIELASVLAGPSVGVFFAELGAKVIKVENNKTGGDVTRSWKLASEDKSHPFSAYYCSVNWGKESWFMDFKNKEDRQKLDQAISKADLVVANFKPGGAVKLRLDFDSLKKLNPTLIYGEITGFGTQNRTAYDVVLQAESGFLSISGTENEELCKIPVALIDVLAAHQLKEGLLLALLQHQREVKALKVTVSLYDTALASLVNQGTNWIMGGHIAKPMGTLHPNIAPYGELFTCKDGKKVVLAIGTNQQFLKLCEVLECKNIIANERFLDNQLRVKNRLKLAKELSKAIDNFNREELMQLLLENQVPAGALRNMKEDFELPEAQDLLQKETKEGKPLTAVKSVIFKITD